MIPVVAFKSACPPGPPLAAPALLPLQLAAGNTLRSASSRSESLSSCLDWVAFDN